jgi:serine phosphatase RsbU (regulator of sigma subunit)
MSWGARFAAVGVISGMCGTLYAGFLMYQKVEEIANLDLEAYQKQMEIMDTKVTEAVDYSRDIKNGLRDDIIRIEQQVDRIEDIAKGIEDDTQDMIDRAEERFENRREQLRLSQDRDIKELEDRLNQRLQRALDNPLSDQ